MERQRKGLGFEFAIIPKGERNLVGVIGLTLHREHRRSEIGYWVARNWQGRGLGTEALYLVMKFAFEKLKIHKIFIVHFAHNEGSRKLIVRAGFRQEGIQRQHNWRLGKYQDDIIYGMLDKEWPASKKKQERLLRIRK
jgi:hypothetical protein